MKDTLWFFYIKTKLSQQIKVQISLHDGKSISTFSHLKIEQSINNHHSFELRFPAEILEMKGVAVFQSSQKYLGKGIVFVLSQLSEDNENHSSKFKGIITEIDFLKGDVDKTYILLKGYSPTILIDNAPQCFSFQEKNLGQIVKHILTVVPDNSMGKKTNPGNTKTIPYLVQYKETGHSFLTRIASENGEWYFYDGENLVFGNHPGGQEVKIHYNRDISEYNFSLRTLPLKFNIVAHDYLNYQNYQSSSEQATIGGLSQLGKVAYDASASLFSSAPLSLVPVNSKNKSDLDSFAKIKKATIASNLVYLKGSSDDPSLSLGKVIAVSATTYQEDNYSKEDIGKFIVTSVIHSTDGLGNYSNYFTAIPSSVSTPPEILVVKPISESQTAVVKKNDDPESMGRVQVQFPWQQGSDTTPWIRMVTPHGGAKKGFYFIPEVGEDVLVGFEQNDPDLPYVIGALYQGKAKTDIFHKQNYKKGIKTKSGNSILFDDEGGKEKIHIVNKDGTNEILITMEAEGKIMIKAKTEMDISAKNIKIHGEEIKIEATKNISISANENITVKSKNKKVEVMQNLEMKSMKTKIQATQELEAKSTQVKIEGSAKTSVKSGAQLELNGGALATMKAGIIQLN